MMEVAVKRFLRNREEIMGYKPRQLGHVNIYVRNAERARDWYEDLLGLQTFGFMPGRPPS